MGVTEGQVPNVSRYTLLPPLPLFMRGPGPCPTRPQPTMCRQPDVAGVMSSWTATAQIDDGVVPVGSFATASG